MPTSIIVSFSELAFIGACALAFATLRNPVFVLLATLAFIGLIIF